MNNKLNNIIFLNEDNIHKYVNNYRSVILYNNGGMWIDSDTIILKNFDELIKNFINSNLEIGCDTTKLKNDILMYNT